MCPLSLGLRSKGKARMLFLLHSLGDCLKQCPPNNLRWDVAESCGQDSLYYFILFPLDETVLSSSHEVSGSSAGELDRGITMATETQ